MEKKRIIIIEDELAVQRGLTTWLSDEYDIKCFNSAEEFLESINNLEFKIEIPTCILLDFQMPGMSGVELQNRLRQMNSTYPIAFMSGNAKQADIIDAWHGGAVDFILKPFSGSQISSVLEKLFDVANTNNLTAAPIIEDINQIDIPISKREAEALLLLGSGHRQSEVAEIMGVSLRTVKMYRTNLKNKLGLNSPVDISRYCDRFRSQINKIAH